MCFFIVQLRQEKVDLENQLEREQEYVVNKLRKQLAQVHSISLRQMWDLDYVDRDLSGGFIVFCFPPLGGVAGFAGAFGMSVRQSWRASHTR